MAALITISPPDENGVVTVSGAAGAVPPASVVAVRNLYTQQTVYLTAGITGTFSAQLFGPDNTPFLISSASNIPPSLRNTIQALPGGPGTIVYGAPPEARTTTFPVTQLMIDGDLADWDAYPQATLEDDVRALLNTDSLYIAVTDLISEETQLVINFTLDNASYELTLDPFLPQTALVRQIAPAPREPQTVAVAYAVSAEGSNLEARLPLATVAQTREQAVLDQVFTRTAPDTPPASDITVVGVTVPRVEEQDGIVYPGGAMSGTLRRFSVGGALAQGAARWNATGRIDNLTLNPGDTFTVEMDVVLQVEALAQSLFGLSLLGEIGLQPVIANTADGQENIVALHTNNGWSNVLTPSGLAVDNLRADIPLQVVTVPAPQVVRRGNQLLAGMRFTITLPDDLPQGVYVPYFRGTAQIGDGEVFRWEDNGVFGVGTGISPQPFTRLPVVLNVGQVEDARLVWTLFHDTPSDGSRGILAAEDADAVALSNRVRFNSPTYILPPGAYPLEPYLLNLLPNSYDDMTAPLLPLLFPAGRMTAIVTLPDGTVDDLPDAPFVQNRLSTGEIDERVLFGGQSPLDAYRLATLNALYDSYTFDTYGEYAINLAGFIEDVYGNRYSGGGDYRVLIAELLDLTPGVLPGTPFQLGDTFFAGGHITPQLPAEVDIQITVYGLDGSVTETRYEDIVANDHGYFIADDAPLLFQTPGEYVIDYEARYTDDQGRLWAASLRSAGIVASRRDNLIAHGARGLMGYPALRDDEYRPAWFTTALYPPDTAPQVPPILNYPYHLGDVAYVQDAPNSGIRPVIHVQDMIGRYAEWLLGTIPQFISAYGWPLDRLIAIDELPLIPVLGGAESIYKPPLRPDFVVNDAYTYISAVRPDVTLRQYVAGSNDTALPLYWNGNDPFNRQIGAGVTGNRPGDFAFLFGGAVVRNAEINLAETAAYAALAVTTAEDDTARIYPPYRGAAGGADGGPLLTVGNTPVDMFFHPTGVRPAQVMRVNERMAIAGQVAPTLPSIVDVLITAPNGQTRQFSGQTNATGYYYDPGQDFEVDVPGVWTVQLIVTPAGESSAGLVEPPLPRGGVLGVPDYTFRVYVLPENAPPLDWSQGGDVDTAFRAAVPFNFGVNIPADWQNVENFYIVKTDSMVYETGSLRRLGNVLNYQYSPRNLANIAENIEFEGEGVGASSADVVTVTFVVTGTEPAGNFAIRTRTFTILHDRLVSFENVR
ncbi:MAG: hypothetical protein OHK0046_48850 [Anaerolineae bacterium]